MTFASAAPEQMQAAGMLLGLAIPRAGRRSQLWRKLRLLCCSGLDLLTIAPDALRYVRQLIPCETAAVFLTSERGEVEASFQEEGLHVVADICMREPQLFAGPQEFSTQWLMSSRSGIRHGKLLNPQEAYFSSNTYQLLVRGSGHAHVLDGLLRHDGRDRGILALYREPGTAFSREQLVDLAQTCTMLEHARHADLPDDSTGLQCGSMLVADTSGRLLYASPDAVAALADISKVGRFWPNKAFIPEFLRGVTSCLQTTDFHAPMPRVRIPVPEGELECVASWLAPAGARALAGTEAPLVGITLSHRKPSRLAVFHKLAQAQLTAREMEVAFWILQGGKPETAKSSLGISPSVYRDCARIVYQSFGCRDRQQLLAHFGLAPRAP